LFIIFLEQSHCRAKSFIEIPLKYLFLISSFRSCEKYFLEEEASLGSWFLRFVRASIISSRIEGLIFIF
jgi:hypothetical protein